ncbi:MAG: hypothetical protein GOV00_00390 [Candidatus Altiarchaeota archaeon]|nr:hypothetical protein [Candidatus Altiarchaeota archaeon]
MLRRLLLGIFLAGLLMPAMATNYSTQYISNVAKGSTFVTSDGHFWTYEFDFGVGDSDVYEYDENYNFINSTNHAGVFLPVFGDGDLIFESEFLSGNINIFNTTSGTRTSIATGLGGYKFMTDHFKLSDDVWLTVSSYGGAKHGVIFHTNGTVYDTITFPDSVGWGSVKGDMFWGVAPISSPMGLKVYEYNVSTLSFSATTSWVVNHTIGDGNAESTYRLYSNTYSLRPIMYENYMVLFGTGNQSNTLAVGVYDFETDTFSDEDNLFVGSRWGSIYSSAIYNENDQKLYLTAMGETIGPLFFVIDAISGNIGYVQASTTEGVSTDTYDIGIPKQTLKFLPVDTGKNVISFIMVTGSVNNISELVGSAYFGGHYGFQNLNYILVQYNGTEVKYETLLQENGIDYFYSLPSQVADNSIGNKAWFYRKASSVSTGSVVSERLLLFEFPEGDAFTKVIHTGAQYEYDVINTATGDVMDVTETFTDADVNFVRVDWTQGGNCEGPYSEANITLMNVTYPTLEMEWSALSHHVSCLDSVYEFDGNLTQYETTSESYGDVVKLSTSYGNNIASHDTVGTLLLCASTGSCYVYFFEGFSQECYAEASFTGPSDVNGVSPPITADVYAQVNDPIADCALTDYSLNVSIDGNFVGVLSESQASLSYDFEVGEPLVELIVTEVPLGPFGAPTKYTTLVNANATISVTEGYQPDYGPADFAPIIFDTAGGVGADFAEADKVTALGGSLLLLLLAGLFVGFKML